MPLFVKFDQSGLVEAATSQGTPPGSDWRQVVEVVEDTSKEVVCRYTRELSALCNGMVLGIEVIPRPALDAMAWNAASKTFEIPPCPDKTSFVIFDLISKEQMYSGQADSKEATLIQLQDPGAYEIELTPPLPYLSQSQRIAVDA